MSARLVCDAMQMVTTNLRSQPRLIVHSDYDSQHASGLYWHMQEHQKLVCSMTHKSRFAARPQGLAGAS